MSWPFWATKNQILNVAVEPNGGLFLPDLRLFYGYSDFKHKADEIGWLGSVETRLIKDYNIDEGGMYRLEVRNDFEADFSGPYRYKICINFANETRQYNSNQCDSIR